MEAALKASIALFQLRTQNPMRRRAARHYNPNPSAGLIPLVCICAGLFRVLVVPTVPEGDHTEGSGWAGLPRRHGHWQRQVDLLQKFVFVNVQKLLFVHGTSLSGSYQIPPLVTKKTAVVVSPLLSLMQDQVMILKQKGVKSEYLGSTQTNSSVSSEAEKGMFDVLYMTPEKAISLPSRFWNNLQAAGICLLAIDEAHCISEWGHDFRMEYKQLHLLRDRLEGVPFVALTATATESSYLHST
nr:unnamed protein product [Digitaria exilis]